MARARKVNRKRKRQHKKLSKLNLTRLVVLLNKVKRKVTSILGWEYNDDYNDDYKNINFRDDI